MKSYLISSLHFRFSTAEPDTFIKAHPHDWLLWEPGTWKPPASTTLIGLGQSMTPLPATPSPSRAGEALALALEPKKGAQQVTLGRGSDCDAVINDGTLSQLHLVFMRRDDGVWTVRDAQSRNGSTVDGVKLQPGQPMALKSGAKVMAAQVAFSFYTPQGMLQRLKTP